MKYLFLFFTFISVVSFGQTVQTNNSSGDIVNGNKNVTNYVTNVRYNIEAEPDRELLYLGFRIANMEHDSSVNYSKIVVKSDSLNKLCQESSTNNKFFVANKRKITDLMASIYELLSHNHKIAIKQKALREYDSLKVNLVTIQGVVKDSIDNKYITDVSIKVFGSRDTTTQHNTFAGKFYFLTNKLDVPNPNKTEIIFSKNGYTDKSYKFNLEEMPIDNNIYLIKNNVKKFKYQVEFSGGFDVNKTKESLFNLSVQRWLGKHFLVGAGLSFYKNIEYKTQYSTLYGLPPVSIDSSQQKITLGLYGKYIPFNFKIINPFIETLLSYKTQQVSIGGSVKVIPRLSLNLYINYSYVTLSVPNYQFNQTGNSERNISSEGFQKISTGLSIIYNFNVNEN